MGCGDACPIYPGKRYEDWELDDPAQADLDGVRRIRDEIAERVRRLAGELALERMRRPNLARRAAAEAWPRSPSSSPAAARSSRRRARGALGAVGISLVFGLVIMVDGLRDGPPLRRAHQPRRDGRLHAHPPLPAPRRASPTSARSSPARPPPRSAPRRLARPAGAARRHVPSVGVGSAFVYELVLTAFLMFVIMAVATDTRAVGAAAAIAIGGAVGARRPLRRPGHRRFDEPRALVRPGARRRRVARLLVYVSGPSPAPPSARSPTSWSAARPQGARRAWPSC